MTLAVKLVICITGKLKKKAQVALPMDKARNMMGVADETGTLQYGEIFVYPSGQDKPLEREGK